ncbi:MAG: DUF5985 family protein [Verrucomicrobiota bacterium]|jgi:hypothetical protein
MNATTIHIFVSGAIMLGFLVAGLFFLRFWRQSRDRLFAIFALAFVVLACERVALLLTQPANEIRPLIYLIRLFAFLLILGAIIDKNRKSSRT